MSYILSILATAVLFFLLIMLLASRPHISKKVTTATLFLAAAFGLFIYTYGYLTITGNFTLAVLKAVLGICAAFVGGNEFAAISSVPVMQTDWMQYFSGMGLTLPVYLCSHSGVEVCRPDGTSQSHKLYSVSF